MHERPGRDWDNVVTPEEGWARFLFTNGLVMVNDDNDTMIRNFITPTVSCNFFFSSLEGK